MSWEPDYVTTGQLRTYGRADSSEESDLQLAVTSASRAVDDHCGRQFGRDSGPVVRYYTARPRADRGRWVVQIDDLMTAAGLIVTVELGAVDLYTLEPRNAVADGLPWTRLVIHPDAAYLPTAGDEYRVGITANPWGWTATPMAVQQATLLQANRFLTRSQAPFGVAGSPQVGSELRLLAKVDPDVAVSLRKYVHPRKRRPR